jgi:hypothetical protein
MLAWSAWLGFSCLAPTKALILRRARRARLEGRGRAQRAPLNPLILRSVRSKRLEGWGREKPRCGFSPVLKIPAHNTLFYGDNLAILREHIADESVDLIYLDPPFNSTSRRASMRRSYKVNGWTISSLQA